MGMVGVQPVDLVTGQFVHNDRFGGDAVSYTHLDVYKRQALDLIFIGGLGFGIVCSAMTTVIAKISRGTAQACRIAGVNNTPRNATTVHAAVPASTVVASSRRRLSPSFAPKNSLISTPAPRQTQMCIRDRLWGVLLLAVLWGYGYAMNTPAVDMDDLAIAT